MTSTQQQEEFTIVPIRWQALQSCPTQSQFKSTQGYHQDMLLIDDAAVATHTQEELQSFVDCFSHACNNFGIIISLNKTNVLGQDTEAPPVITINDYELDAVCQFTYICSTVIDNLSLDADINKSIVKAASTLTRLTARVWTNPIQAVGEDKYGTLQYLCYQHIAV